MSGNKGFLNREQNLMLVIAVLLKRYGPQTFEQADIDEVAYGRLTETYTGEMQELTLSYEPQKATS